MESPSPPLLTDDPATPQLSDAVAHYTEHGWAPLGRLLDEPYLERLRRRADDFMLGVGTPPGLFFQRDAPSGRYEDLPRGRGYEGPSLDYRKLEKLETDPLFLAWIAHPLFERVARLIPSMRAGGIVLYRAVLFTKSARGGTDLPWHQDGGPFWGLSRDPELQVWTALDDAPLDAGPVEVVPRSHVAGLATPLGGVIPETLATEAKAAARAYPLVARAGEVFLIHNHLWHRSGRNFTGAPRRALTVCYMSADTRCLRTRRAPRTFFPLWGARD